MADRKIHLVRIAHVFYKHKNIAAARAFYEDFGFLETARVGNRTYYRGYGTEPFVLCAEEGDADEFLGPGFVVESLADLEHASKTLPNATGIYELEDVPGGGKCVTFKDPVDGWPFHLVFGQEGVEASAPEFPELRINYVSPRPRPLTRHLLCKGIILFRIRFYPAPAPPAPYLRRPH
ncbi:hypothetical protein IMZ48_18440 [Candidatus Bathyarchaeota archaeon]|nr:hypothetical protein [Candidatus Bathyarchaeota archaeon]